MMEHKLDGNAAAGTLQEISPFEMTLAQITSLEFALLEQADPGAWVQAIANLREPRTTTGGVNLVAGFRPSLWRRVASEELPAEVTDFDQGVRGWMATQCLPPSMTCGSG